MNCKPGDLAIIVKSFPKENIGKTVTCLRLLDTSEFTIRADQGLVWLVDREIVWHRWNWLGEIAETRTFPWVPDECLMPIQPPKETEDEQNDLTIPVEG